MGTQGRGQKKLRKLVRKKRKWSQRQTEWAGWELIHEIVVRDTSQHRERKMETRRKCTQSSKSLQPRALP